MSDQPQGKSFSELLATEANYQKDTLVLATLEAFRKGEPSAIKLVTQALLDSQDEEERLPISDERFEQIITMAAKELSPGNK